MREEKAVSQNPAAAVARASQSGSKSVSLSVCQFHTESLSQTQSHETDRESREGEARAREAGRYRQCSAGSEIHASLVRRGRGEANRHTDRVTYRGGSDGFNTLPPEKFNEKYQLEII